MSTKRSKYVRWLPVDVTVPLDYPGLGPGTTTYFPGWVDVRAYPVLKPFTIAKPPAKPRQRRKRR